MNDKYILEGLQIEAEVAGLSRTHTAYQEYCKRLLASSPSAQAELDKLILEASEALDAELGVAFAGDRKRMLFHRVVAAVGSPKIAMILVRGLYEQSISKEGMEKIVLVDMLARSLYDQYSYETLSKDEAKRLRRWMERDNNNPNTIKKFLSTIRKENQSLAYEAQVWRKVALTVLEIVIGNSNRPTDLGERLVDRRRSGRSKDTKTPEKICLHPDVLESIASHHPIFDIQISQRYQPMRCPPTKHTLPEDGEKWGPQHNGGYMTPALRRQTVKGKSVPSQTHLDALNAVQDVPYSINPHVFEAMEYVFDNNIGKAGVAKRDITKPVSSGDKVQDAVNRNVYRKQHAASAEMGARLRMAKECLGWGQYWIPYCLDFRGRFNASCILLSPHSSDLDRGLVQLATPVEQTDRGIWWLKVSLANACGVDKVSFDDRVAWVDEQADRWAAVALDPIGHLDAWVDLDEPWQALAAICELHRDDGMTQVIVYQDGSCNGTQHLAAMSEDKATGACVNLVPSDKPSDYYQVTADAMADIMQSLLGSDGKTVSREAVLNSDRTLRGLASKIQQRMDEADEGKQRNTSTTDKLITQLNAKLDRKVEAYQMVVDRFLHGGKLSRKVIKRSVMCMPYGITEHGRMTYWKEDDPTWILFPDEVSFNDGDQVFSDEDWASVEEKSWFLVFKGQHYKKEGNMYQSCLTAFSNIFDAAMARVSGGPMEVMRRLKEWCHVVSVEHDTHVEWTTPTGMLVKQRYYSTESVTICGLEEESKKRALNWVSINTIEMDENNHPVLNGVDSVNGIAPNFIHSHDAAHMVLTINDLLTQGIRRFMFVHDAFGAAGPQVDALRDTLRKQMVEMNLSDAMNKFHREIGEFMSKNPQWDSEEWDKQKYTVDGDLEIEDVVNSDYFFG